MSHFLRLFARPTSGPLVLCFSLALPVGCGFSGLDVAPQSEEALGPGADDKEMGEIQTEDPRGDWLAGGSGGMTTAESGSGGLSQGGDGDDGSQPELTSLLQGKTVLFLHDEEDVGVDDTVLSHIRDLGNPFVRTLGESLIPVEDLGGYDLVVVSSLSDGADYGEKLARVPGPTLVLEPVAAEALGVGPVFDSWPSDAGFVSSPEHAIAGGTDGEVLLCQRVVSVEVNLVSDPVVNVVSHSENRSEAVVYAVERGALILGEPRPARLAGTGLLQRPSCMTERSWSYVDRAIRWLLEDARSGTQP